MSERDNAVDEAVVVMSKLIATAEAASDLARLAHMNISEAFRMAVVAKGVEFGAIGHLDINELRRQWDHVELVRFDLETTRRRLDTIRGALSNIERGRGDNE